VTRYIGVKLTHDAAVALIEDSELKWSLELEKFDNNARYTEALSLQMVRKALDSEGFEFRQSDVLCIDGWRAGKILRPTQIDVAGYWPDVAAQFVTLSPFATETLRIPESMTVASTPHITGHVLGAYLMSPHAGTDCDVLMWDGGTRPTLYRVDQGGINDGEALFNLYGTLYGIMGYYAGPFKKAGMECLGIPDYTKMISERDWPGKLMSWIGHGKVVPEIVEACERAHNLLSDNRRPDHYTDRRVAGAFNDSRPENAFMQLVMAAVWKSDFDDTDILRSIHEWMGIKLLEGLNSLTTTRRLVFVGGSALNIKWNSMIRAAGYDIWVPPCPNDSGSAIGAAVSARWYDGNRTPISWSVYSGPKMVPPNLVLNQMPHSAHPRFTQQKMTPMQLGEWLYQNPDDYVVVLHGRAEIGPRALGHRSIFMVATEQNKDILNRAKKREHWRPVAPIVLEEHAPHLFSPGNPDPYMLFDHKILPDCAAKYPAIWHVDGTARIQTVGPQDCPITREILEGYWVASKGWGLLCNTSANLNGSGFFPDLASADKWCAENIWDGETMWTRKYSR
jgi:carbamoyltransferase